MTKPRIVRNFWLELEVDGKKEKIATGPKSSGGGFTLKILMRENGKISEKYMLVTGGFSEKDVIFVQAYTVNEVGDTGLCKLRTKR